MTYRNTNLASPRRGLRKAPANTTAQVASRREQIRSQVATMFTPTIERWLLGLTLLSLLCLGGCRNPYATYQYRHTGHDFCGDPNIAYYHYPHGSWFIPAQQRSTHCPTMVEAPFHGFQSTCWTQWPEPWCACPPPGMQVPAAHGEVIETPTHEPMPIPQPEKQSQRPAPTSLPVVQHEAPRREAPKKAPAPARNVSETRVATLPAQVSAMPFVGKHGFSGPEEGLPNSAAVIELPSEKSILNSPGRAPEKKRS